MKKIKFNLSFKLSLIIMLISFLGIGILAYLSFNQAKKIFIENSSQLLERNIERFESFVNDSINSLKYDTTMLSFNSAVLGFLRAYHDPYKYDETSNKTYAQFKKEVETLFNLMMRQNESYFQMRIIDSFTGQELIRLERNDNKIIITSENYLQNKSKSKYFKGALKAKDIYISEINLNREYNNIEFPIKPTIRVAKLIKLNGINSGIVIINSNIATLFDFEKLRKNKQAFTFITNERGDYILNTKDSYKEFGFEFGKNYKIYDDFPILKDLFFSDKNKVIYYGNKFILESKKIKITPERFLLLTKKTTTFLFDKKARSFILNLVFYIIIISLIIAIITAIIVKKIAKPIIRLSKIANEIAITKGDKEIPINISSNDEIGDLAKSFQVMLKALVSSKKEIEHFANKLENEVENKTKELKELNKNLQDMVNEKISEIRKKDKALINQSKLAAMGEMIGAISHQWRQPLNMLALNIQLLIDMAEDKNCDVETIEKFVEKNMKTINFMSKTIDDFRNFFREDKEKVVFDVKDAIESTISLLIDQLYANDIILETKLESMKTNGFKNEFIQVILNLISNAKDAILEKMKDDKNFKGKIYLENYIEDGVIVVKVKDNAGGIPNHILDRIFEPYFTTKEQGKGTGMGLYMSKEIIGHVDGELEVRNTEEGAEFIIRLALWKE